MRILLSIPSLAAGGSERQFAELAAGLAEGWHEVLAVALGQGGPLADSLGRARLAVLGKTSRLDNLRVAWALARLLRREKPHIHYAFLPTCSVLGALLQPWFPATRLVLGVRAAGAAGQGLAGRALHRMEARLSHRAALVIANSRAGLTFCLGQGFPQTRTVVVPNGIDTARWRPDRALGAPLRAAWGVGPGELLLGLVARLDPLKDHRTFLVAAASLAARRPDLRFVCVGGGSEHYARSLRGQALSLGLGQRLIWAGERPDMEAVYNSLDALCLSSVSEGFPNVLGEALSCGVPCAATDVGDAGLVLDLVGELAPSRNAPALEAALERLLVRLARNGQDLRQACRARVEERFSAQGMVAATEALLLRL